MATTEQWVTSFSQGFDFAWFDKFENPEMVEEIEIAWLLKWGMCQVEISVRRIDAGGRYVHQKFEHVKGNHADTQEEQLHYMWSPVKAEASRSCGSYLRDNGY